MLVANWETFASLVKAGKQSALILRDGCTEVESACAFEETIWE